MFGESHMEGRCSFDRAGAEASSAFARECWHNSGQHIADVAARLSGQQLWKHSPFKNLTADGAYGCAASASEALKKAGYRYANSPTVGGLVNQLKEHGWTQHPAGQARPGDVMVGYVEGTNWQQGGGNAHVGVVSRVGTVFTNTSRANESWKADPFSVAFSKYNNRFVLRAPQSR